MAALCLATAEAPGLACAAPEACLGVPSVPGCRRVKFSLFRVGRSFRKSAIDAMAKGEERMVARTRDPPQFHK